ncbi:hypothetical protein [Nonomuraea rhodomycinica]|uniref:Uncharacterized protein n=1 Tax=Nonomuraea rhodomycinica TaxID=1712872 RepID=A0A7Y6ISZ3_9ACTN|nr:hypothetical protein [Nonomuraea rhodomycinica]NUW43856.1 hypothetical protein [Nonomuraea rhodomycinica]
MRKPFVITVAAFALAAAAIPVLAAAAPPASAVISAEPQGKYWHVKSVYTATHPRQVGTKEKYWVVKEQVSEHWADHDGRMWSSYSDRARPKSAADLAAWKRDGSPQKWTYRTEGMLVKLTANPHETPVKPMKGNDWLIGERKLSFQEIQSLPTTPEGLRSWLVEASAVGEDPVLPENFDLWVKDAYTSLLYRLPAPKPVRAAAYQALSALPGVKSAKRAGNVAKLTYGYDTSGYEVKFGIVVDTGSMAVVETSVDTTRDGEPVKAKTSVTTYEAGWTDTLGS